MWRYVSLFSDYLLAIMARFCVVVVTAVCCLVTGSFGDDNHETGWGTWLGGGSFVVGEVISTDQKGRYTQLVTGIAHVW